MNGLKEQYRKSLHFLGKDLSLCFLITYLVFIGLCAISFFIFRARPQTAETLISQFMTAKQNIIADGKIDLIGIFLNNLWAAGISVAVGFVPFLFLPAIMALANAVVMGAVMASTAAQGRSVLLTIAAGILPHGIFELSALVMAWACGFYICWSLVLRICRARTSRGRVAYAVSNGLRVFLTMILPLLIAAALIETYLTPVLVRAVM